MSKLLTGDAAALQGELQQAEALRRQGKLSVAASILDQILQRNPDQFEALYRLGLVAQQSGEKEHAAGLLQRAITANPSSAEAHVARGAVLASLGRFAEAITCFDQAILLRPDDSEARAHRDAASHELTRFGGAPPGPVQSALDQVVPESIQSVAVTSPSARSPQEPFAVAVIMTTILRPSLIRAAQSVFAQRLNGTGQLLIGIDKRLGDHRLIDEILTMKPDNWVVTILDLGYSTSVRHGGVHDARDGGALRTILSYCANSRYLAYLDDDNWWAPNHLSYLLTTIRGCDYAYTYRWFVDADSLEPLAIDTWESVGPNAGVWRELRGGFIDPNTLMIDKVRCKFVLQWWSVPLVGDPTGMTADRHVFDTLRKAHTGKCTQRTTCYYGMTLAAPDHAERARRIRVARESEAWCTTLTGLREQPVQPSQALADAQSAR